MFNRFVIFGLLLVAILNYIPATNNFASKASKTAEKQPVTLTKSIQIASRSGLTADLLPQKQIKKKTAKATSSKKKQAKKIAALAKTTPSPKPHVKIRYLPGAQPKAKVTPLNKKPVVKKTNIVKSGRAFRKLAQNTALLPKPKKLTGKTVKPKMLNYRRVAQKTTQSYLPPSEQKKVAPKPNVQTEVTTKKKVVTRKVVRKKRKVTRKKTYKNRKKVARKKYTNRKRVAKRRKIKQRRRYTKYNTPYRYNNRAYFAGRTYRPVRRKVMFWY